jgi:uncharacterized protein (TIGR00304 family)
VRRRKMNRYYVYALLFLIGGVALLGYAVASGEASVAIVVFIPVVHGSGIMAFLGMICIIAAIFLAFLGFANRFVGEEGNESERSTSKTRPPQPTQYKPQKSVKGGGVVLIGPIPVIFGSDTKMAIILVILAIILIIAVAFFFYL